MPSDEKNNVLDDVLRPFFNPNPILLRQHQDKSGIMLSAYNGMEGVSDLDIEKYLDKVDQDRRDSETRIHEERKELEARMDARYEQFVTNQRESETRMRQESQVAEARYRDERKESEARIDARFIQAMSKFDKMDEKLDSAVDRIEAKGTETTRWVMGLCITTILAIAALVIAIFLK